MNVKKAPSLAQTDYSRVMFTANLLSFYQQLLSYQKNRDLAILHNLEKPLWIFVGATVQGESSDVALVTRFFREAVDGSLKDVARRILSGDYLDDEGNDLFGDRFDELGRISSNHGKWKANMAPVIGWMHCGMISCSVFFTVGVHCE